MKLTITKDFTYWHGGCRRVDYVVGQEVDADDQDCLCGRGKSLKTTKTSRKTKAHAGPFLLALP